MSQRTKVVGARTSVIWLLIAISLIVIAALAVGGLVIYPQLQRQQAEQARVAEAEQHYQAGLAFQNVSDVDKAAQEYEKVIVLDANYKDVQSRLAEVKAHLAGSAATATAVAMAEAGQVQATVQAMATAAQATAAAGPTATAEALEAHYQKGLGYLNIGRWADAKTELEQVFAVNPTYKEVQVKLKEVEATLVRLTPTATPIPRITPTPVPTPIVVVLDVQANPKWQSSGMELKRGDNVTIEYIRGQWQAGPSNEWSLVGPEGVPGYPSDPKYTLPNSSLLSLIAKTGDGPPFRVGKGVTFGATSNGILWLGANDDHYDDNYGALTVRITVRTP